MEVDGIMIENLKLGQSFIDRTRFMLKFPDPAQADVQR